MRHVPAAVLLGLLLTASIGGPWLAPFPPLATSVAHRLEPPSALHWCGTDALGRDVFSRVLAAARIDLPAAAAAVALSALAGVPIGTACGYLGGALDRWVGRGVDVLMAFPLFVVAMALVAALGSSLFNVVLATAIINLPFYIRLARAEVAARRGAGYVLAARLGGASEARVVLGVLLPGLLPTLSVQVSLNLGWALLNTASLSFMGLGVAPPTPEWGVLVADGARYLLTGQWWVALCPGIALVLAVFTFTLAGDGARDLLDPRRPA
jgi:peptide/nickel transport system permease protein